MSAAMGEEGAAVAAQDLARLRQRHQVDDCVPLVRLGLTSDARNEGLVGVHDDGPAVPREHLGVGLLTVGREEDVAVWEAGEKVIDAIEERLIRGCSAVRVADRPRVTTSHVDADGSRRESRHDLLDRGTNGGDRAS